VYTIFTNEQLAEIAEKQTTTKAGLQAIDGIGEARVKKYGDEVARIVADRCRKHGERK
jgi:superfamily II DNA helicase RecQ